MIKTVQISEKEAWDLAFNALVNNQTSEDNAKEVADARAAWADVVAAVVLEALNTGGVDNRSTKAQIASHEACTMRGRVSFKEI